MRHQGRGALVVGYLTTTAIALIWTTAAIAQPSVSQGAGEPAATAPASPPGAAAPAGSGAGSSQLQEIVVTAQKRSERINTVPLTITAASGATLQKLGVTDSRDLAKLVPGFTFAQTGQDTPVYTLRGVGYYDSALGATPAVTVYVDQIPLTYPQMTRNAVFDLERVEVLKGPQGTLFGQNSTGGAINYIAAKPTNTFQAGAELTGGRFDEFDASGFLSGPLTDTVKVRLAVDHDSRGDWQESYTRPGDARGQVDISRARLLIDWKPISRLTLEFGATAWQDQSDTQAAQLIARTSNLPAEPAFYAYPLAPDNARAADWSPNFPTAQDDTFYQFSLRGDYQINDILKLTSITSFAGLKTNDPVDEDGTALAIDNSVNDGHIGNVTQEGRAEIDLPTTRIVVGGNYEHDLVKEEQVDFVPDSAEVLNESAPGIPSNGIAFKADQHVTTYAVFANVEQKLTQALSIQGGVRYTDDDRHFQGCFADDGDGKEAAAINFVANALLHPLNGIPGVTNSLPGGCLTLDNQLNPEQVKEELHQNNISWRVGPSYKITPDVLVYVNVSKGYKAGTFPTIGGVLASQFTPTTQESVLAYEGGFKAGAFGHRLQVNGAGFYYGYDNKQILGTVIDPLFGPLQQLVNVPKSELYGAELEVTANPVRGLTLDGSATYVHSEVTSSFLNFNPYGSMVNFKGSAFPFTPTWNATAGADYTHPINDAFNGFVGGNVTYASSTVGAFGANVPYNPDDPQHEGPFGGFPLEAPVANALNIRGYATLDLRAGVATSDGAWRLTLWGRNVTNTYYWTNASYVPSDATVRFAALPATYGATLTYRFGGR